MSLPLIIWNHRWEYDKKPDEFFRLLFDLKDRGLKFEVAILGEHYKKKPQIFDEAKEVLAKQIVHFGYVENRSEYKKWLSKGDLIPVTSMQDFFGESLVQAMYQNCYPLVPNRLAFPEHFPDEEKNRFIYNSYTELVEKMTYLIAHIEEVRKVNVRRFVEKYSWKEIINEYDELFEKMIKNEK